MTVKELKQALEAYDENLEVFFHAEDKGVWSIDNVTKAFDSDYDKDKIIIMLW